MAKTQITMAELGGGIKVVEGNFTYTTADTAQTITVNGLTQIDELIVYNTPSPEYSVSAFMLNGTFYANNLAATNPSRNKITAISGNQFTMYWQASGSFSYIAIQN